MPATPNRPRPPSRTGTTSSDKPRQLDSPRLQDTTPPRPAGQDERARAGEAAVRRTSYVPYRPDRHYEGLSTQDSNVLALAAAETRSDPPWSAGTRDRHIREGLDMSPTGYHQRLVALLAEPNARKAEPIVLRLLEEKLNRLRQARGESPLRWE
ncbi:DUF3263 domain-containing protein [Streptomyces sp. NPDC004647]|uniref:DUF3263 domain-containing protein n=1 Tax=Streptomyces sp. NPDC004647 TaxID=3154671 RepID=UPI0033A3CCE7